MSRQPQREPWPLSRLLHERAVAMGMALERSSITAYNSHLNSYLTFCRIHDRPITPTVNTLSFFIVYMSAHIRPDSVVVYLAGVCNRLESEFPEVRQHRTNPIVKRTLAGCLRRARQQPSRKPPLDLTNLYHVLRLTTPAPSHDELLFAALLGTGFFALMRLGELVWPDSIQLQSYHKVILRQTLAIDTNGYSFTLPTHKTARLGHGNTILVRAFPASPNPVPIMLHYVRSRDHLFYSSPELWLTGDGHVPTRAWFTRRLRKACGMEFSGHSMRAGGATTLALSGTPPYVIQAIGRWASEEWQKYVRKHAYLQQALLHGHPPAPSSGQWSCAPRASTLLGVAMFERARCLLSSCSLSLLFILKFFPFSHIALAHRSNQLLSPLYSHIHPVSEFCTTLTS